MHKGDSMQIVTNLRRSDLVLLSLYMLPSFWANWVLFGIVVLAFLTIDIAFAQHLTSLAVAQALAVGLVAGVLGMAIAFLVCLALMLVNLKQGGGVLGQHTYTLREEGLHEETAVNQSLQKWSGIQSIIRRGGYVMFRLTPSYLFHIIPRRSFSSDQEFEEFWSKANSLWRPSADGARS